MDFWDSRSALIIGAAEFFDSWGGQNNSMEAAGTCLGGDGTEVTTMVCRQLRRWSDSSFSGCQSSVDL